MTAKETVIESGFAHELDWQHSAALHDITEQRFLSEAAWVILSAGMRESVIRAKFPLVSKAFRDWLSAKEIVLHKSQCRRKALGFFGNERKIGAIIRIAEEVALCGFAEVHELLEKHGTTYIEHFPFMGPATSFHLAKNLGLAVVKPDRHLMRVATYAGYPSPDALCREIADVVGDKISVVDLVIWRYATINRDYLQTFCPY